MDGALYGAPLALAYLFLATSVIATPALIGGFRRRGTGRVYEARFSIQRAPQIIVALNVCLLFFSFHLMRDPAAGTEDIATFAPSWMFSLAHVLPPSIAWPIAWSGVLLSASGVVFLVCGWYSLGDNLSTDAELLHDQTLCTTGVYAIVMHPVYTGVVQSLLGAALVSLSAVSALMTWIVVAPLFVRRARYEEKLLAAHFGRAYLDYAERMRGHRFLPKLCPLGPETPPCGGAAAGSHRSP